MKSIFATLSYWKLAVFRVALYSTMVGVGDFLTDTETWSQETWDSTGLFLKLRMFLSNGVAMMGVVLAFLDQTMGNLRNGKTGETQIITKP